MLSPAYSSLGPAPTMVGGPGVAIATHKKKSGAALYRFGRGKDLGKRGRLAPRLGGPEIDVRSDVFGRLSEVARRSVADCESDSGMDRDRDRPGSRRGEGGVWALRPPLTINTGAAPRIIIGKGGLL